jgi:hypothetical protein
MLKVLKSIKYPQDSGCVSRAESNMDELSILRDPRGCNGDGWENRIVTRAMRGTISSSTVQDASGCTQSMDPIVACQFVVTWPSFFLLGWSAWE